MRSASYIFVLHVIFCVFWTQIFACCFLMVVAGGDDCLVLLFYLVQQKHKRASHPRVVTITTTTTSTTTTVRRLQLSLCYVMLCYICYLNPYGKPPPKHTIPYVCGGGGGRKLTEVCENRAIVRKPLRQASKHSYHI